MKNFVLGIVFALLVAAGGLASRLLGYADAQGGVAPSRLETANMSRAIHA